MIKVLVVLVLLLFLLAMIAVRYRRQIKTGIEIFKMFRQMRAGSVNASQERQIRKQEDLANAPLVKCIKCGTWVPQPKAMKLGGNTYCSAVCVERSEVRA
jgi:hypothetical protein